MRESLGIPIKLSLFQLQKKRICQARNGHRALSSPTVSYLPFAADHYLLNSKEKKKKILLALSSCLLWPMIFFLLCSWRCVSREK